LLFVFKFVEPNIVVQDSKITTVLAMTGGIAPVISKILKKEGKYVSLVSFIQRH
jgi:hypothetical protein